MRPTLLAATALLAAAPAFAAEHIVDIAWNAQGGFRHGASVAAGKFIELCGKLPSGAKVQWSFDAAAPVDFNIHFHRGKEVVVPAEAKQATRGGDTLAVSVAEEYCWMWTNKTAAPVRLAVQLQR
jgi:hypothetical protein